jgi:hypothetical protein
VKDLKKNEKPDPFDDTTGLEDSLDDDSFEYITNATPGPG